MWKSALWLMNLSKCKASFEVSQNHGIMELLALARANLINCKHTQKWRVSGDGAGETTLYKSVKPGFSISPWTRKWQPASVFLLGKSHGQRSLAGYSPQGNKKTQISNWALSTSIISIGCFIYSHHLKTEEFKMFIPDHPLSIGNVLVCLFEKPPWVSTPALPHSS